MPADIVPRSPFPVLAPGDLFAVKDRDTLGAAINFLQRFWDTALDDSEYCHNGIITRPTGETLEAVATVREQNLFDAYAGEEVLIVRHTAMTEGRFLTGMAKIAPNIGQWYPVHRLLLHLLRLAKYVHWRAVICSELVAKFLVGAGLRRSWYGVTPDNLTDQWKESKHYDIIFEGRLPGGKNDETSPITPDFVLVCP
jgi:hypothetical protein